MRASTSSLASQTQLDLRPSPDYMWVGHTRISVPNLQARATTELQLHVAVFAPGWFEVSDYSVSWTYPELDNLYGVAVGPTALVNVVAV